MDKKATRRVYAAELSQRTGYGTTWLRTLEDRGSIPKGRKDPGGKRRYWPDDVADQIVAGIGPAERQDDKAAA